MSPVNPYWSDVAFSAVNGREKYLSWKNGVAITDPRLKDGTRWSFVSKTTAEEVFKELLELEQEYWLRIIERQVIETNTVVCGYSIEDGQVVRETDGSNPVFMRKEVAGCLEDMPELQACA